MTSDASTRATASASRVAVKREDNHSRGVCSAPSRFWVGRGVRDVGEGEGLTGESENTGADAAGATVDADDDGRHDAE